MRIEPDFIIKVVLGSEELMEKGANHDKGEGASDTKLNITRVEKLKSLDYELKHPCEYNRFRWKVHGPVDLLFSDRNTMQGVILRSQTNHEERNKESSRNPGYTGKNKPWTAPTLALFLQLTLD